MSFGMIINHNLGSMNALEALSQNQNSLQQALQQLSTGKRINSAADDAAGLAISQKMQAQINGLTQASQNAQDGISLIQTAEGALSQTQDILQRMRQLAVQASNGTNTTSDTAAIQQEVNQLTSEINRIGNTTQFNTLNLLQGSNAPAVTTAAGNTTLTQGQTGVAAGALSSLNTVAKSVVGVASTTSVQGATSEATGAIGNFAVTQNSTAGTKASLTLANGMTFTANNINDTSNNYNGTNISIVQGTGTGTTSSMSYNSGTFTITIGTDQNGNSLATNQGTLYNQINSAISGYSGGTAFSFTLQQPTNTATPVTDVTTSGTTSGGTAQQAGTYQFSLSNPFKEAGDTVTVGGQTFTAVASGTADASSGQFDIRTTLTGSAMGASPQTVSGLNNATTMSFSVAGQTFTISNTDLQSAFNGTNTNAQALTYVAQHAKDSNGETLSDVANVSVNASNEMVIQSKNAGADVSVNINDGSTGSDLTALKTAFGVTSATTTQTAIDSQTANLAAAIQANSTLGTRFGTPTVAGGQITLTEAAGQATGTDLTSPTAAGNGSNNELNITNGVGKNLGTVTIVQGEATSGQHAITGTTAGGWKIDAGAAGTELNGVSVKFNVTAGTAASSSLTQSWDAASQTLTVSGSIGTSGAETDVLQTVHDGLSAAGFTQLGSVGGSFAGAGTAASGTSNIVTDLNSNTITFGDTANGGKQGITAVTNDTLAVDEQNGNLTIHLADSTASKNSAANIQSAIQALGNVGGYDFSKYTVTSSGSWDSTETGSDITRGTGTLVGGTTAVDGKYSTTIDKAFAAGDQVTIKGQTFTAVASGADSSKGQFNVGNGTASAQAASLIDAINLNKTLSSTYLASASGSTITLTENKATGTDMTTSDVGVSATGVAGQYSVAANQLLTNGGSFSIDGQKISVSDAPNNVGYGNGTAIQQASTVGQQTQELAGAINQNASLSQKYTASVDNNGNLLLTQKTGNSTGPSVQMTTSTEGDFQANFQIGANTGQTMTIDVKDMRAEALGVAGDGSTSTVAAANGQVASYVATADVTNGTDNTNSQYSLDVSTSGKATAAISVIDDAINSVSQQRSALGAYQNRLNYTVNNLSTSTQNLTTAQAGITDTNMAATMAQFTKDNVLQQAAVSMLAQANQQPQLVLKLLG